MKKRGYFLLILCFLLLAGCGGNYTVFVENNLSNTDISVTLEGSGEPIYFNLGNDEISDVYTFSTGKLTIIATALSGKYSGTVERKFDVSKGNYSASVNQFSISLKNIDSGDILGSIH